MTEFLSFGLLFFVVAINIFLLKGFLDFVIPSDTSAPFVPTPQKKVTEMIRIANILPGEVVYDLGCGDGRIVFAAAKAGAKAIGVEVSWGVSLLARLRKMIFQEKGEIRHASLWDTDISDGDVVFLYLLPPLMKRFGEEKVPTLKKGARIVSHGFSLPGYTPQKIEEDKNGRILLYIL